MTGFHLWNISSNNKAKYSFSSIQNQTVTEACTCLSVFRANQAIKDLDMVYADRIEIRKTKWNLIPTSGMIFFSFFESLGIWRVSLTAQKLANSLLTVKHSAERKSVLKPAKCLKLLLSITPPQHSPSESKNLAAVNVIQKVSTAEIKSLNSVLLTSFPKGTHHTAPSNSREPPPNYKTGKTSAILPR